MTRVRHSAKGKKGPARAFRSTSRRKAILVLGMHRSGTSAITRVLSLLGARLPKNLMPANPANEEGYWESMDLYSIHEEILSRAGSSWHDVLHFPEGWFSTEEAEDFQQRILAVLRREFGATPLFVIKDPRISRLVPLWLGTLRQFESLPHFIIPVRHPLEIAASLKVRDGLPQARSLFLWLRHIVEAEKTTRGQRRSFVSHDALLADWRRETSRIRNNLRISWEEPTAERCAEIDTFLSTSLRHHEYSEEELDAHPEIGQWVKKIYRAAVRVARDDSTGYQREFDAVRHELENSDVTYGPIIATLHAEASNKIRERTEEIERLTQTLAERDAEIDALAQTVGEREATVEELKGVVQEREATVEELKGVVQEREATVEELKGVVQERDRQLALVMTELDAIRLSTSWRITKPVRIVAHKLKCGWRLLRIIPAIVSDGGGPVSVLRKAFQVTEREGLSGIMARIRWVAINRYSVPPSQQIPEANELPVPSIGVIPHYLDPMYEFDSAQMAEQPSIAIQLHLFYEESSDEVIQYLGNIPYEFDLYVSVQESANEDDIRTQFAKSLPKVNKVIVERVPNQGRNLAPLIVQFGKRLSRYDIIGHVHTKLSPHRKELAPWFKEILDLLFGPRSSTGRAVGQIVRLLSKDAKIVYPQGNLSFIPDQSGWADNYDCAKNLLEEYTDFRIEGFPNIEFPQGCMFWAKAECLRDFLTLPLKYSDFPAEPVPPDGTIAHALERLILIFASKYQGRCYRIHDRDSVDDYAYYEEQQNYSRKIAYQSVKVLSYYLPQFHVIPENSEWHGVGFTDWTKVRTANPLFLGHYQQHMPHSDIGYYMLDSPESIKKQAEMMKKSGIHGQVFYHYWFGGKLILEKPARMLLENRDIDMPFCFCWANENWTRTWDGNESDVLLSQEYSTQDAADFINYLAPFFRDDRYIRIENRPVLFIYRPSSIPDPKSYLDIWGRECGKYGLKRPYVVAVLTRGATSPLDFGMDAGVERVLHDWTNGSVHNVKNRLDTYQKIKGSVLDYDDVASFYMNQNDSKPFTYFRSLIPIWDNTARYGSEAFLVHRSTPEKFQNWLEHLICYAERNLSADRQIIIVNAWNEWAEGAHLEPDTRFGYGYLNSVGRALSGIPYANCLYRQAEIPQNVSVNIRFPAIVLDQLDRDGKLKQKFFHCLTRSTIFNACHVTFQPTNLADSLSFAVTPTEENPTNCDYVLEIRRISVFSVDALEQMLRMACYYRTSVIIANGYGTGDETLPVRANGSVERYQGYTAPFVLYPAVVEGQYKNVKLCSGAKCFITPAIGQGLRDLPVVTTIIRFHKNADMALLDNALLSLLAMVGCIVQPMIAAQDLSREQRVALADLVNGYPWDDGYPPIISHYKSEDGSGDLRSKMLNESLKSVRTKYVAFLDYDDVLFPFAYAYLIERLRKTGKAATFGRVYVAQHNEVTQRIISRKRGYEYGYNYEDFLKVNHAPLHSFMLDLEKSDLNGIVYFEDQKYMEDYYLTLQIFSEKNTDWESLTQAQYIGDYIHSIGRRQTLAIVNQRDRESISSDETYKLCERRIHELRNSLK